MVFGDYRKKMMSRRSSQMSGLSHGISVMSGSGSKASPRFDQTLSSIDSSPGGGSKSKSKIGSKKQSIADSAALVPSLMLSRSSVSPISESRGKGDAHSHSPSNAKSGANNNAISAIMQAANISI